ncbi:LysR family transcriptional regulator [Murinocardiopsis flavida]|uniref:LysR family transcriptional regulator n=1 Tax=Murinocardiopsis flavida TaxID=645275 RepID=A0A2P8DFA5_9ACTN|nr:LysR family transcriptional regulator [Murinocardiopsis flavida]PSK95889.1 LysR family transcriptional regulator [Murinocardiopsis flavida]
MLSLPALRLLHELRLRGTLTGAAEALFISRSAASHQLAVVQRAVGVPLTEKVGRGLRLTETGAELALRAERVLRELEEAEAAVERGRGTPSGTVRVGVVQTIAVRILAGVLTDLRRDHPQLRVEAHGRTTEDAVAAVRSAESDLAVVPSYGRSPLLVPAGLHREHLFHDPVRLAVAAGHPLAHRSGAVRMAELAGERWIAGDRRGYFGRLVPDLCREGGFEPDIVHRSTDFTVVAALVGAGHGVALIPASADLHRWPGVRTAAIDAEGAGREVVALVREGSTERPGVHAVVRAFHRHSPAAGTG